MNIFVYRLGIILYQTGMGHNHSHGGGGGGSHGHAHAHAHSGSGSHSNSKKSGNIHAEKENINVRAAFIHVLGDIVQSVGVLIAAYIIKYKVCSSTLLQCCNKELNYIYIISKLSHVLLCDLLNVSKVDVNFSHFSHPSPSWSLKANSHIVFGGI